MRNLKITPLILAIGGLLAWFFWQVWFADFDWSKGFYVLLLFLILVAADQYCRVLYRDIRRLWLIEAVFLVIVFVIAWMLNRYL